MKTSSLWCAALIGILGTVDLKLCAQTTTRPATSQPASQPTTTTAPAAIDPAVDQLLDRLERKGDLIQDIQCKLKYISIDRALDDEQKYEGELIFKTDKPNPHFLIRFDKFEQAGIVREKKEWHAFDGQWYIEVRESTRTIVRRQVVRPDQAIEVFRLGEGPFPLPFGQKKDDILVHFTVKQIPPNPQDPPNSDHLACTPKPDTDMAERYETVHFWIDRQLDLPVRVQTVDKQEHKEVIAQFAQIQVNTGIAGSALNPPRPSDYAETEERLPPDEDDENDSQ